MVKASSLAIATAVVGGLAVGTTGQLRAAPIRPNTAGIKLAAPAVVTDVRYREYVGPRRRYYYPGYYYSWGYPDYYYSWGYPGYAYSWGYPTYSYWPNYYYGYGW